MYKKQSEIKTLARALVSKISTQRPIGPESNLMFAIFSGAVVDYFGDTELHSRAASIYLTNKTIPHLEVLGINTEWAMGLFKKAGLEIKLHPHADLGHLL